MAIAVIPARGGSKRIPRKNVRPFAGAPMISYPIRAALGSGAVESVFVTTDSTGRRPRSSAALSSPVTS